MAGGMQEFQTYEYFVYVVRRTPWTPDPCKAKARLQVIDQKIVNIMRAIKVGIFTQTAKEELDKLEADRQKTSGAMRATAVSRWQE